MQINPNEIQEQSLQVSSQQVAAESTFIFTFQVANSVPAGGFLEIGFPLTHFEVPSEITASHIKIYDLDWLPISGSISSTGLEFTMPDPGINQI